MGMGPGQPARECCNEDLIAEFEAACRGGDYEFAPEYRAELLRRLTQPAQEGRGTEVLKEATWKKEQLWVARNEHGVIIRVEEMPPKSWAKPVTWIIFKVSDDYIVAETAEQAIAHHLEVVGQGFYTEGEEPEAEVVPDNEQGKFEREDGNGYDEMTFGEWLADFEYTGPQIICWNE